ncbi:MAG: DUF6273 domain-containing protein [Candidatus Pelethousia sp.]|nr:DUF6273 domain-containing protein [Candidatus Pelethousia sp.]
MMAHRRRMLLHMESGFPARNTLENTAWKDIALVAAAGRAAEYWAVGDIKSIAFSSEVFGSAIIEVKILDFNYDDLADGSGKAPISFGMVDSFVQRKAMNATMTNTGGWGSCALRPTLISTVLPALEAVVGSNVIKAVNKRTSAGYNSPTILTTTDSVWMFSEYEIFGSTPTSFAGEKPPDKSVGYPVFTNAASRIKKVNGLPSAWHGRSPYVSSSTRFCAVDGNGVTNMYNANSERGISIGFCI